MYIIVIIGDTVCIGRDRSLVLVESRLLLRGIVNRSQSSLRDTLHISPRPVEGVDSVTTFAWGQATDGVYLCVATAEKVLLLRYSISQQAFHLKKVCLLFI